jgi:hypothetical protein
MQGSQPTHQDGPKRDSAGGFWRLSAAHFLIALILLLVTVPFVLESPGGKLIEAALFTLVFLSAVLAVGGRRRTLFLAGVLVTPAVAGTWLDHKELNVLPKELTMAAAVVFSVFVIMHLLRFILEAPRVDGQVLCAAISTYLMLALLWAFAYAFVARLVPQAFLFTVGPQAGRPLAGFDAMYFSFCTLTTVGYGDIVPMARVARQLAVMESTTGTLYVTVLIARLVSLYSAAEPPVSPPTTLAQLP